ncbi:MAG: hypothetical protein ACXWV9_09385 [Flavisolibacter sp.]
MVERKPDRKRGYISFATAMIIGLIIGIFLKRVQLGLIIGLSIGLLSSSLIRRR